MSPRARWWHVICPTCTAAVGKPCVSWQMVAVDIPDGLRLEARGRGLAQSHRDRRIKAKEASEERVDAWGVEGAADRGALR